LEHRGYKAKFCAAENSAGHRRLEVDRVVSIGLGAALVFGFGFWSDAREENLCGSAEAKKDGARVVFELWI